MICTEQGETFGNPRTDTEKEGSFMKNYARTMIICMMCAALASCAGTPAQTDVQSTAAASAAQQQSAQASAVAKTSVDLTAADSSEMFTERDFDESFGDCTEIIFSAEGVSVNGSGASADGSKVLITAAGSYRVTGECANGQIAVNAPDEKVQIVLAGASLTCSGSAALYVMDAGKVFVTAADGTANSLTSEGEFTASGDDNIDGAVFAKSDLTFNGSGSLTVTSGTKHGIVCKDDLKITGGTISVTAAKKGIDCKESVRAAGGTVTINSGSDGIHAENEEEPEKAFVYVCGGTLDITSGKDAIDADGSVTVCGGDMTVNAGDDGLHSEGSLLISDGTVNIEKSKEGIEGAVIEISGGNVKVTASDDGINATGSGSNTSTGAGGFGGMMDTDASAVLTVSGGELRVNAGGDGIDSNGYLYVTGGTTYVSGPVNSGNGALDYGIEGKVTGGRLIAAGSLGMAENFGQSSTQGSILYSFGSEVAAGTEITLTDSTGSVILSFTPEKKYQCAVLTAPEIVEGGTYTITAGSESGTVEMTSLLYGQGSGFGAFGGGRQGGGGGFGGRLPEGQMPDGEMPEGQMPQMPDGGFDGERPQRPGRGGRTDQQAAAINLSDTSPT